MTVCIFFNRTMCFWKISFAVGITGRERALSTAAISSSAIAYLKRRKARCLNAEWISSLRVQRFPSVKCWLTTARSAATTVRGWLSMSLTLRGIAGKWMLPTAIADSLKMRIAESGPSFPMGLARRFKAASFLKIVRCGTTAAVRFRLPIWSLTASA